MHRLVVIGPNLPDQSKGQFHVHAEGCGHLDRGWLRQHLQQAPWDAMSHEFENRHQVEQYVYSDAMDEAGAAPGDWLNDFHFAPCTRNVPTNT